MRRAAGIGVQESVYRARFVVESRTITPGVTFGERTP
jgi:hypothetical protein